MTLPGLAGGTAISMTFVAKVFGSAAAPASTTASMFVALADAKTSAGAPEVIWVARAELAAKLKVTLTPGWAASNCCPSVVNDSVSDAAANTVMSPDDGDADPDAVALVALAGARAGAVRPAGGQPEDDDDPREQGDGGATHADSSVRSGRRAVGGGRVSASSGSRRRRWSP